MSALTSPTSALIGWTMAAVGWWLARFEQARGDK